jgi:hypothetical protein
MSAAAKLGRRILLPLTFSAALFFWASGVPWLGTPARLAYADDAITDPFLGQPDAIAEGDDLAGDLQARNIGGPRRRSIAPLPLQDVRPIDAGRRHLHQYLAGRRLRRRPLAGREHLRSAGLLDLDGGHGTGMGGGHERGSLGLATGRAALV